MTEGAIKAIDELIEKLVKVQQEWLENCQADAEAIKALAALIEARAKVESMSREQRGEGKWLG